MCPCPGVHCSSSPEAGEWSASTGGTAFSSALTCYGDHPELILASGVSVPAQQSSLLIPASADASG